MRVLTEQEINKQLDKVRFNFKIDSTPVSGVLTGILEIVNNSKLHLIIRVLQLSEDYGYVNVDGGLPIYEVAPKSRTVKRADRQGRVVVARPVVAAYNQGFGKYAVAVVVADKYKTFNAQRVFHINNIGFDR